MARSNVAMLAKRGRVVKNSGMSIYLDHNATTPIHAEVVEAMTRCHADGYANPASPHRPGQRARRVLEDARERIAELLGANLTCPKPDRLVLTASATEANNLALLGIAQAADVRPGQLVISAVEHASVIEPAEHLLDEHWQLDTLAVDSRGVVRGDLLPGLLGKNTALVSVILGNHDTGVLQPVDRLAEVCDQFGVPLHTDAVQVVGKLPVNFRQLRVAAMTVTAHKFGGPVGVGALLLRHDTTLKPLLFGGHQQSGLWPGTESVPLAVGMLTALEICSRDAERHRRHLENLRQQFEDGLRSSWSEIVVHGESASRLPQTSNIAFPGLDGQVLLMALDLAGVACSAGSACSSGSTELSPTLRAMGLPSDLLRGSLRFSVGATNTEAEIREAVGRILDVCRQLRSS